MLRGRGKFLFATGTAILGFIMDRILSNLPAWISLSLFAVALTLYAGGLWDWSGKFNAMSKPNRRKETIKLRLLLVGLFVFAGVLFLITIRGLMPQPTLNAEQLAMLDRYRRFYLNSDAPNKTTLIEMTNRELKIRGTNLYTRIKAMNAHYSQVARNREARHASKEIDDIENGRLWREEMAQAGEEYDRNYRTEARMVLLELRNRTPYQARKHILGMPSINPADNRAGQVSLYDVFPAEFSVGFSDLLAREIEELVKLLPDQ
jgi:hypothetical protein